VTTRKKEIAPTGFVNLKRSCLYISGVILPKSGVKYAAPKNYTQKLFDVEVELLGCAIVNP
jgi:hypothetical protein